MRERNALVVGGLVALLLILPFGYLFHVSPRFPGSLVGSMIGIAGAVLMLMPLAYLVIKRVPPLRDRVTRHVSMQTLLAIHIYAGVLGPILGLIHAAHKFQSPLGVSLTGMMLVVVVSGYIGRYLLAQISRAVRGRRSELAALQNALSHAPPELPVSWATRLFRWMHLFTEDISTPYSGSPPSRRQFAKAMADVEFAVRAEAVVQKLFEQWLRLHILIAIILYLLLALHIWSGLYYGLRWL
jgi:hypothetical protein